MFVVNYKAKKNILVMHPGPLNRGIEISSEVADGQNSVILEQVTNGIAVRMAVLFLVAQARDRKNAIANKKRPRN